MSLLITYVILFFSTFLTKDVEGHYLLRKLHRIPGGKPKTLEIIKARGFIGEMHVIKDLGYPLTLYRIINPLADQTKLNKYPVLYGHGILFDAESMISRSENARPREPVKGRPTINFGDPVDGSNDYSLPFMYSNNNFDVWLFDARGANLYNRNTSIFDLKGEQKFWDFSLDDQGLIDLPVIIDFVLAKTNSNKLVYTAFSQTSFFAFALLSRKPEYADKFVAFVVMAPVAYLGHLRGSTVPLLYSLAPAAMILPGSINYNFVPKFEVDAIDATLNTMCSTHLTSNLLCKPIIDSIGGKGSGEITPDFMARFYKITSLKTVRHLMQLISNKKFCPFDYGLEENLKRYGRPDPPSFELSKIKADRLVLFRGGQDAISTSEDQEQLLQELGTKPFLDVQIPYYNHFDMITGKDLIQIINEPAMMAVYELMYRDGPNILKEPPSQNMHSVEFNETATNESARA